jgi:hypothetical protein
MRDTSLPVKAVGVKTYSEPVSGHSHSIKFDIVGGTLLEAIIIQHIKE